MTWTYDEHALDQNLNRIRLEIGDTDTDRPLLKNEEIDLIISEVSNFNLRVAGCCRLICSLFAGKPERFRIEDFSESQKEIYDRYEKMAARYEARGGGGGAPWTGSIEAAFKEATKLDTSLVKPLFKRGMHDNRNQ